MLESVIVTRNSLSGGEENKKKQIEEFETHIHIDFRLLDVSLELSALEDHLELIENQIQSLRTSEKIALDSLVRSQNSSPDDFEWDEAYRDYYHKVESLLPRLFRGPFFVSLYAVYEAVVTEVARLIQRTLEQPLSLNDIRDSDFLDRAKKYYRHVLRFELCGDNTTWQQIIVLSELRNAMAHTNGRWEMLGEATKDRIKKWKKTHTGLEIVEGYIIADSAFLRKTFGIVRSSLDDLVERYKLWDDSKNPSQKGLRGENSNERSVSQDET